MMTTRELKPYHYANIRDFAQANFADHRFSLVPHGDGQRPVWTSDASAHTGMDILAGIFAEAVEAKTPREEWAKTVADMAWWIRRIIAMRSQILATAPVKTAGTSEGGWAATNHRSDFAVWRASYKLPSGTRGTGWIVCERTDSRWHGETASESWGWCDSQPDIERLLDVRFGDPVRGGKGYGSETIDVGNHDGDGIPGGVTGLCG